MSHSDHKWRRLDLYHFMFMHIHNSITQQPAAECPLLSSSRSQLQLITALCLLADLAALAEWGFLLLSALLCCPYFPSVDWWQKFPFPVFSQKQIAFWCTSCLSRQIYHWYQLQTKLVSVGHFIKVRWSLEPAIQDHMVTSRRGRRSHQGKQGQSWSRWQGRRRGLLRNRTTNRNSLDSKRQVRIKR